MERKPHISLKAEKIFEIFGIPITNSILSSLIVLILFLILGLNYFRESKKDPLKRNSLYFIVNFLLKSLYNFFYGVLGEETIKYFPLLTSFFLFILLQNWFGLIPGVGSILIKINAHNTHHFIPLLRGGTADLNTTLGLAIFSVIFTNIASIKALGVKNYIARFYRIKEPISFFIGSLEIISEFSKVISFAFRLFGNIFAGEVLLTVIAFLLPMLASFPFLILEIFVGFIQALVFTMLTCVFISLGISKHH